VISIIYQLAYEISTHLTYYNKYQRTIALESSEFRHNGLDETD